FYAARERLHDGDRAQTSRGWMPALDLTCREKVAVEVAAEAALDARAQDLHGNFAWRPAIDHHGPVHLGDGSGSDGAAQVGDVGPQAPPGRSHYRLARLGHGEGRQPVLQVAKVAGELGPDEIGAGCQELAELDVARAEAGECACDAPLLGPMQLEGPRQSAD